MATARDLRGGSEHVVALCGDAAFTCGITYEALNNISVACQAADRHPERQRVVDRQERRRDREVPDEHRHESSRYENLHKSMEKLVERFARRDGQISWRLKAEGTLKGLLSTGHRPSLIFEEMGLSYYGPIDGHDLPNLIKTLDFAKHHDHPLLLHVLTKKSKGFDIGMSQAEEVSRRRPRTRTMRRRTSRRLRPRRRPTRRFLPRRWSSWPT